MISGSSLYIGTSTTTRNESTERSLRGGDGRRDDSSSFTARKSSPTTPIIDRLTMTNAEMPTRPQTSAGLMRRGADIGSRAISGSGGNGERVQGSTDAPRLDRGS